MLTEDDRSVGQVMKALALHQSVQLNLINVMRPELIGRKNLWCCEGVKKKRKNFGASNDLIQRRNYALETITKSNVSPSSGRTTKGYRSKLQLFKSICGGTVAFNGLIMIMGRQRAVRA